MAKKRLRIILNPAAGKSKAKTALFEIIEPFCRAGYDVSLAITQQAGHGGVLARTAVGEGCDLLVCCGGDGTLNEVVSGVLEADGTCPIGYIPAGSTNDFANSLGIPADIPEAVQTILEGTPRPLDAGRFGQRYFTYIASFGAFTAASYTAPQAAKKTFGHLAYIMEGIKDIRAIQPYPVRVEADGESCENAYIFGAVSNSTSVGGIVRLSEELVNRSDGLFEVILIKQPQSPLDLRKIVHAVMSSDFHNEMFDFFRASEVTLHMEAAIPWTLDGEYAEGAAPVVIQNLPRAFSMICPREKK